MKLAIMQPYFLPYLGYFQLIKAADKFVIYDDVNYINKGWINRNNILINAKASLVTLPLISASQNRLINEIYITNEDKEINNLLKKIEFSYKKAPFFKEVFYLLEDKIRQKDINIANYNVSLLNAICKYLDIETPFVKSSAVYNNKNLQGQARILDICLKEAASQYINPIGGVNLYSQLLFTEHNVKLSFIKTHQVSYLQFQNDFIAGLSILDVIMFNSPQQIQPLLNQYELV